MSEIEPGALEPRPRPDTIEGVTQKIETSYGSLYVTINEDEEGLFEVFAQIGKSGGYTASFTEALARLISLCLRSGIEPAGVIDQLQGIRSPQVVFDRGETIHSVPNAIATALKRHLEEEAEAEEAAEEAREPAEPKETKAAAPDDLRQLVQRGMSPVCPECGSTLSFSEGCALIVVGDQAGPARDRYWIGSIADRVVKHAQRTVLVVRTTQP